VSHSTLSWTSCTHLSCSQSRLYDGAPCVRFPAVTKDFSSSLCVQTSSEAHPAFCPVGTWDTFPGGKARPGRGADYSHHLVPRSRMSRSYSPLPLLACMAVTGQLFTILMLSSQLFYITSCRFLSDPPLLHYRHALVLPSELQLQLKKFQSQLQNE
jgi:hypothetical protein